MRTLATALVLMATAAPALAQPAGAHKLRSSQSATCVADPELVTQTIRANRCNTTAADGGPVVELWTMGQGDLMVEKFGHAALCICREGGKSTCYNYGTTDFGRPLSLGWGFIRGDSEFWVEPWPRDKMLYWYMCKDRSLYLQVFDDKVLPADARQRMVDLLEKDTPDPTDAGLRYQYHHFYDNCTTRVRDIIDAGVQGRLKEGTDEVVGPTFRQLGAVGFAEQTWMRAMSDFVYGRESDVAPTAWQIMFHPDYLRETVAAKLSVAPTPVYDRQGRAFSQTGSSGRGWTFLFALIVVAPAVITRLLRKRQRLGLILSSIPVGFIATVIWFMCLASSLPEFRWNEAALLFLPTDAFLQRFGPERRKRYARIRLAMIALVGILLAVGLFKQPLWMPMLVIVPILLVGAYPEADKAAAAQSPAKPDEKADKPEEKPAAKKPGSKAARRMSRAAR